MGILPLFSSIYGYFTPFCAHFRFFTPFFRQILATYSRYAADYTSFVAVDASIVGLNKAEKLAELKKVSITTIQSDLKDFDMGINQWDAIVSIFCHLPPKLRQSVHQNCVKGLKPGGVILIEAYTPSQLKYKTGGPPNAEMMMDSRVLKEELKGLEFMYLQEKVREIHEGEFHYGEGAVVQAVARKP